MNRNLVTAFGVAALILIVLLGERARLLRHRVDEQQAALDATQVEAARLRDEAAQLQDRIRSVRMLYSVEEKTDAGEHVVSPDGQLEMFTRHDAAGHLCAHWCARQDPGGPCLDFGPDRCLP